MSPRRSPRRERERTAETEAERIAARLNEGGPPLSLCVYCRHNRTGTSACDAFPEGIPEGYASGWKLHLGPDPDDRGVRFALAEWVGEPVSEILQRVGLRSDGLG